jgi:hypothetical protein
MNRKLNLQMPHLRFGIEDKVTGLPGFIADTSLVDTALGKGQ